MTKFLTAAVAALAIAVPAAASSEAPTKFERDGYTYVYTSRVKGEAKILEGTRYPGAERFRLVVANGRVQGQSGGSPVSFSLKDVVSSTTADRLASR